MYASSVNMGCLRTVDSKTGNDDASCKDTREIERESKQNASAESTVTTVLCLHYYHSEESQRCVDATHI